MESVCKLIENRDQGITVDAFNQPTLVHVSKKGYAEKERHEYYQLKDVQNCLKHNIETKAFAHDNAKLDKFFACTYGTVTAIVNIYGFARETNSKYIQTSEMPLEVPISNYSGSLGLIRVRNEYILKQINSLMSVTIMNDLNIQFIKIQSLKCKGLTSSDAWHLFGMSTNVYRTLISEKQICDSIELLNIINNEQYNKEKMMNMNDIQQIQYFIQLFKQC